jgi:hypothetical protein
MNWRRKRGDEEDMRGIHIHRCDVLIIDVRFIKMGMPFVLGEESNNQNTSFFIFYFS